MAYPTLHALSWPEAPLQPVGVHVAGLVAWLRGGPAGAGASPGGCLSAGNSWGVWLVLRSHGWVSALALSSVSGPTLVVRVAEMPLLKFNFFSRKIKHAIFHGLGKPWDWYFCLSWCVILFCNNIPFVAI